MCMNKWFVYLQYTQHTQNALYGLHLILPLKTVLVASNVKVRMTILYFVFSRQGGRELLEIC